MNDELAPREKKQVKLSSYRKGDLIASGGYADIFKAHGKDGPVVLRIMKKEAKLSSKQKQQFIHGFEVRRECGKHPHIVSYFGEDTPMLGQPFEVIEYVSGKNLKMLIFENNQHVINKPVHILRQCAASMMHIHQIGFLHLDIKPENYLVDLSGPVPIVKLTDFDLCLPIDAKQAPAGYGGSLMYLAPEYLTAKRISVASDIFAFGVMAFNLCTRQMPFVRSVSSIMGNGNYEIKFPASFGSTLSPRVETLIRKCLAKEPKDRFSDGGELFFALEQISIEETKEIQLSELRKQYRS
jgi:serine/threonine protein kinase